MVMFQLLPYSEIRSLTSIGRIRKILNLAKDNRIVLLQGRLAREEEAELIKATMEEINKEFRGIELAVIDPTKGSHAGMFDSFASMVLGNRAGMTVIGPASIIKSIKKDPDKIELLMEERRPRRKR
ncbi:MAG: DUF2073 domain-containing protein [Nanoarchaeota archaeon]